MDLIIEYMHTSLWAKDRAIKVAIWILVDSVTSILAVWLSYVILLSGVGFNIWSLAHILVLMPASTVLIFWLAGIYRWRIRSSNVLLAQHLAKTAAICAVLLIVFLFVAPPNQSNPRSVFILYGMILWILSVGIRFLWPHFRSNRSAGLPVGIYGAGEAGQRLIQTLGAERDYKPVVLFDDDSQLHNVMVSGVPVINLPQAMDSSLRNVCLKLGVKRLILAIPSLSRHERQTKTQELMRAGVPVLTLPSTSNSLNGVAKASDLTELSIKDILGRDEVPADPVRLRHCVQGKTVLVTGGGGSIGSELCRQIVNLNPLKLLVLDVCEFNLYQINELLLEKLKLNGMPESGVETILCSVTDASRIRQLFSTHDIDTVYHAAAYKHVPIIEAFPGQGIDVNVFGTRVILDAAVSAGSSHFVLVSTDKAVRPANAMGASKRIAELVLQAKAEEAHSTCISMVRFGNVLGSSGSVVPKFRQQIEKGGPITLTHRDVTRYFMTIPEAAQLVLQAGSLAKGGDVFVLDMGSPVRIEDLAISMVYQSGCKLKRDTGTETDIEIVVEGLRPGEKLYEELFLGSDEQPTVVPKVNKAIEFYLKSAELNKRLVALKALSGHPERADELRSEMLKLANSHQKDTSKAAVETPAASNIYVCEGGPIKRHDRGKNTIISIG